MDFRFTKSERIARTVLEQCGIDEPTKFLLSQVILGRKAYYQEKPLEGKDGEIVTLNGKSLITINSEIISESKKRFTAAHELGHYEMHKNLLPVIFDNDENLISWYKGGQQEIEANEFAAEFLMPSNIFYNECKGKKFCPEVIDYLANRFQVSKTAAILRFVKRGNHPIFIVYSKDNKVKWFKASDDFRYFYDFTYNGTPPRESVAYELFTSNSFYEGEERKQTIWKSTWFNCDKYDKNKIFYEYCLYAKSYNYLISVIWET